MLVVDEKELNRSGVGVVVMMKRVAVGKTAWGYDQAVGIRSRKEWYRQKMKRKQLVGITGHKVQADGGRAREVLVPGGGTYRRFGRSGQGLQVVEGTEWRKKVKGQ